MEELSLGDAVSGDALPWQPLELTLSDRVLAELLDGGQSFRWNRQGDGGWRGLWHHHVLELRRADNGQLEGRSPTGTARAEWMRYFGRETPWEDWIDRLPWRSDPALAQALDAFPGLRILQQPLGETLLAFLCSSTKQIVQIKAMMELLAMRFGDPLMTGDHALPTWAQLAAVGEAPLRACKLGYRARYVAATATHLAAQPHWEEELTALPYPEAHRWLCRLPGVGAKVADCVLLFGAHRLEAFPVDTWILKVLAQAYGLEDWKPAQLAAFGRAHFGPAAGLAQQYLFAWGRKGRGESFG